MLGVQLLIHGFGYTKSNTASPSSHQLQLETKLHCISDKIYIKGYVFDMPKPNSGLDTVIQIIQMKFCAAMSRVALRKFS